MIMPNEVEETLRVLNTQIGEYTNKKEEASKAYDEFSLKCQKVLDKEEFDYISDILYRLMKFYEIKIRESQEDRMEIMGKYDIPYNKEDVSI